ncbi:MAG TPA: hypothetical protein VLJ10_03230 [Candidatus Bathyarchaeia archaeon]|nr:hypothetical protein [Candidatus Bathyarchaeia archaeon]
MNKEKNAQSTLETIAVLVLVMVGIMAIGPNVVRSVNAFFKGAQEQAEDSFREEFTQANLFGPENNYRLGDCHCVYDTTPTCGDGTDCPKNRWMYSLTGCSASCQAEWRAANFLPAARCDDEASLASQGRTPFFDCFPTPEDYPKTEAQFDAQVIGGTCGWECCFPTEIAVPLQCGDDDNPNLKGKLLYQRRCGPFQEAQYFWEDSPFCNRECLGTKDAYSTWCSPSYNYDLPNDINVEFVSYAVSGVNGCEQYAIDEGCPAGDTDCYELEQKCVIRCPNSPGVIGTASGCACDQAPTAYKNYTYVNGTCQCVAPAIYVPSTKQCLSPGRWVTAWNSDCVATCAAEGMYFGRNPDTNGVCSSSENPRTTSNTYTCYHRQHSEFLWIPGNCDGGVVIDGEPVEFWCWRPGQETDENCEEHAGGDNIRDCWCQDSDTLPGPAITVIPKCPYWPP